MTTQNPPHTTLDPTTDSNTWSDAALEKIQEIQDALSQRDDDPIAAEFLPQKPKTIEETKLAESDVQGLILKMLLNVGPSTGRQIAEHIRLGFGVVANVNRSLKDQLLLAHQAAAPMGDYVYELSESGSDRAIRYAKRCTYFGAAPVSLVDYINSVYRQSVRHANPSLQDLRNAFKDLYLSTAVLSQIGQAVRAGRGLFLYGNPGNGKTSIAERLVHSVNQHIWIPRTIAVNGEIIRLFDPNCHTEVPIKESTGPLNENRIDRRWVQIMRPSVVVGGELTLDQLEITPNPATGISEAPVQLKSNGGALVVDDFGRQRITTTELLNRWIVPLEKGFDLLSLPSGCQLQIPFDQLLVFATNLEPREIVDEAFLRRIPYKIEVFDPTEEEYRALFRHMAKSFGFQHCEQALSYLVEQHYHGASRSFRFCHVRDLLLQVKHLCEFLECPLKLTKESFDVAVYNYFAGL